MPLNRKTWSDRILKSQRTLLDLHAAPLTLHERPVTLSNTEVINVVVAKPPTPPSNPSILLLLHGWGSGLAFFSRALPILAPHFTAVYLVDVPGMGASSRPSFPTAGVTESLDYFITRLQQMRDILHNEDHLFRSVPIKHLAAHSMGAYISAEWMLRNPSFQHLILISPVGVPSRPDHYDDSHNSAGIFRRSLHAFFSSLWKAGVTPQAALKLLPTPMARSFCETYISRRYFGDYLDGELQAMTEYCLHLSKAPTAGEKSISTLLQPGAWPVVPLMERLPLLQNLPVTFVYGDRDWMDWRQGERARKEMRVPTRLCIVDNADHNVFVDNASGFANVCLQACADVQNGKFL